MTRTTVVVTVVLTAALGIGLTAQQGLVIHPTLSGQTFKHILVPIWLLTYVFGSTSYQVLVNGCTGRIAGKYPINYWKVFFVAVAVVFAVILVLLAADS